jgi:hypothetical protein
MLSQFTENPRRTLLGDSVNKRAATIHPGTGYVCGRMQASFREEFFSETGLPPNNILGNSEDSKA